MLRRKTRATEASDEGGHSSELSHNSIFPLIGQAREYIYLFPVDVGKKQRKENEVLKSLANSPQLLDHKLGFSKVNHIDRDFYVNERGDINFMCTSKTILEGFYHRSPYYVEKLHRDYFYIDDEDKLLQRETKRLLGEVLRSCGFAKEARVRYLDTAAFEKQYNGSLGFEIGGVNVFEGELSAGAKFVNEDDAYTTSIFEPKSDIFQSDFAFTPQQGAFLAKHRELNQLLQDNLACLKKKNASAFQRSWNETIVISKTSTKALSGLIAVPVTESIQLKAGLRRREKESGVTIMRVEVEFYSLKELETRCKAIQPRPRETLKEIEAPLRSFTVAFKEFFDWKQFEKNISPKRDLNDDEEETMDTLTVTFAGPKAAGKSSTIYTLTLAPKCTIDLNSEEFMQPPPGIVVRLNHETDLRDGTSYPGVTEVEAYKTKYAFDTFAFVLQDTIGILPNENNAKEIIKRYFKDKMAQKYSITGLPDAFVYVLNGEDFANAIAKGDTDSLDPLIDQIKAFAQEMHPDYDNTIKVPLVIAFTKKDKVKDEALRKRTIAYLMRAIGNPNIPIVFTTNIEYARLHKHDFLDELVESRKAYEEFKNHVRNAFTDGLYLMKTVTQEAKKHVRRRSRNDYQYYDDGSVLSNMLWFFYGEA